MLHPFAGLFRKNQNDSSNNSTSNNKEAAADQTHAAVDRRKALVNLGLGIGGAFAVAGLAKADELG